MTGDGHRRRFAALVCCILLMVASPPLLGEGRAEDITLRLPGQDDPRAGSFFRDKFACARWVERGAPDKKCLECHRGIDKPEPLPGTGQAGTPVEVTMIHAQHMSSVRVHFKCTTCHKGIDPYQASSAGLRDQVSANMCFKCHFPHGQE